MKSWILNEWGATVDRKEGSEVVFKIMPASDAIIGRYKVRTK